MGVLPVALTKTRAEKRHVIFGEIAFIAVKFILGYLILLENTRTSFSYSVIPLIIEVYVKYNKGFIINNKKPVINYSLIQFYLFLNILFPIKKLSSSKFDQQNRGVLEQYLLFVANL